jgi:hypothetical protein
MLPSDIGGSSPLKPERKHVSPPSPLRTPSHASHSSANAAEHKAPRSTPQPPAPPKRKDVGSANAAEHRAQEKLEANTRPDLKPTPGSSADFRLAEERSLANYDKNREKIEAAVRKNIREIRAEHRAQEKLEANTRPDLKPTPDGLPDKSRLHLGNGGEIRKVYPPNFIGPIPPGASYSIKPDGSAGDFRKADQESLSEYRQDKSKIDAYYARQWRFDNSNLIKPDETNPVSQPFVCSPNYGGGGLVRGVDGQLYPIVIPRVLENGQLFTADDGLQLKFGQQPISSINGRDPGWQVVDRRQGNTFLGKPAKMEDKTAVGLLSAFQPSFNLPAVPPKSYRKLKTSDVAAPVLLENPVVIDSEGPPSDTVGDLPPRAARAMGGLELSRMIGSGAASAANLDEQNRYNYDISFEENTDGRRRAIIKAYHLIPGQKTMIQPRHVYVGKDGAVKFEPIRYRQNGEKLEATDRDWFVERPPEK